MRLTVTIALAAAGVVTPGAVLSAQNAAPAPALTQTLDHRSAGSYRITVAGFRVNHDTYDDPLNRDGWGDEIYASVVVQRFNRATGRVQETRTVTSQTHGDGNAAPGWVPQGHASDAGGLTAGDVVPFGWDEKAAKPPVEKGRFPLVVWEGPLADGGDVLVLRPALWEHDGDRTAFDFWSVLTSSAPNATWELTGVQQSLATTAIAPVPGLALQGQTHLLWMASDLTNQSAAANREDFSINPGRDRPIGLRDHKWYDQVVVLGREKIEAALRQADAAGRPPGLITLRLKEEIGKGSRAPQNGDYVLYLRVERH